MQDFTESNAVIETITKHIKIWFLIPTHVFWKKKNNESWIETLNWPLCLKLTALSKIRTKKVLKHYTTSKLFCIYNIKIKQKDQIAAASLLEIFYTGIIMGGSYDIYKTCYGVHAVDLHIVVCFTELFVFIEQTLKK